MKQIWIILSTAVLHCACSESDVTVLDSENFDKLTKGTIWFVNFYAPWCGHCKRAMPLWEETARKLKGSSIRVGKVDADAEAELGEKFEIQGFPTFKIIEGKHVTDYKGEHKIDAFIKFALEYKPRAESSRRFSMGSMGFLLGTKTIREALEALASESLAIYTGVVWGGGFMAGAACGILFALRERAKLD